MSLPLTIIPDLLESDNIYLTNPYGEIENVILKAELVLIARELRTRDYRASTLRMAKNLLTVPPVHPWEQEAWDAVREEYNAAVDFFDPPAP